MPLAEPLFDRQREVKINHIHTTTSPRLAVESTFFPTLFLHSLDNNEERNGNGVWSAAWPTARVGDAPRHRVSVGFTTH
jgi:hypothetical protein